MAFSENTSGRTPREWIRAMIVLLVGLAFAGLGISLFMLSELGIDTFTVLVHGLALRASMSVGTMHIIVQAVIFVVIFFAARVYIKPGVFVCVFFSGPFIDLFSWLLGGILTPSLPIVVRIAVMLAGCAILALGMSVVINSNAGTGTNDLIALVLSDRIPKIEFRWIRVGCDVVFVATGWLLGGTVGIGTLAAAFLTGPMVQFWLAKTRPICRKIIDGAAK